MTRRHELFARFNDFDETRAAILGLQALGQRPGGGSFDKIRLVSPIPHPELEEVIGTRPVSVQRFTLFGALLGAVCGFLLAAAMGQSMFTVQPQGGKPVIPIPANLVIMYELTILFGVWFTLFGFLYGAGLPWRPNKLYSHKVAEDQVGVWVEVRAPHYAAVKATLQEHRALEILEQ